MAKKLVDMSHTIVGAVGDAFSELENLCAECQEVVDNVSGTSLENTARNQTMADTADLLSNINEPPELDDDEFLAEIGWKEWKPTKSNQLTRSERCDNAIAALSSALDAIENIGGHEDAVQEIQEAIDWAEQAEFPGRHG